MTTTVRETVMETRCELSNISWETYESLLRDYENSGALRFTYDKGELVIMSPLPEHEGYTRLIELSSAALADELDLPILGLGSTTFRRSDLERGFEADAAFYVQNLERVRGRSTFDLQSGPPPDLVVEIEITRSALDKLDLFAAFGAPEVWRYDGSRLEIRVLEVGGYLVAAESRVLPGATAEALTALLAEGRESQFVVPLRRMREWARGLLEEVGK